MHSPGEPTARRRWRRSSARTCSSYPSTTCAAGGAITTCSPISCACGCSRSTAPSWRTCTAARARGSPRTGSLPRRSATRSPPRIRSGRPTCWRRASPSCGAPGTSAACAPGWRRCRPASWRSGLALGLTYAGTRLQTGEPAGTERYLDAAERWLAMPAGQGTDEAQRRAVTVEAAMYRSALALLSGDRAAAARAADRAMAASAPASYHLGWAAATLGGLARWGEGDLDGALARYAQGMASLERAGHRSDVIGCLLAVADMRIAQGRLEEALGTYRQGLALAEAGGAPPIRGAADMLVGIGGIACERGDLAAATALLERSDALGRGSVCRGTRRGGACSRRGSARRRGSGGALALVTDAEPLFTTDMSPDMRPIGAVIARVRIGRGRPRVRPGLGARAAASKRRRHRPTCASSTLATPARLLLAAGPRERHGRRRSTRRSRCSTDWRRRRGRAAGGQRAGHPGGPGPRP